MGWGGGDGARDDKRVGVKVTQDVIQTGNYPDKLGVECHNQIHSVVVEVHRATFTLSDTGVIYVTSTQNGKKRVTKE